MPEIKIGNFFTNLRRVGGSTLIIVGIVLSLLGLSGSFFFTQTIEKFFWEARTKSALGAVAVLTKEHLIASYIAEWDGSISQEHLNFFATEIKHSIPNIAAIKIFTSGGTLAWTDLQNVKPGYYEKGIEIEISEVAEVGHMVKPAGDTTRDELNSDELLEVWAVLNSKNESGIGFIEIYFDSSDISNFITRIQVTTWVATGAVLVVTIFLLRLAFRKQDELIFHQAHELSSLIEKSPIGIYTINNKGVVTTINKKMLNFLGETSTQNIVGRDIFSIPRIQEMNTNDEILRALSGEPFEKDTSIKDELGNELYRHCHGTPIMSENNNKVEMILFMVEDITDQKILEKEVALRSKTLEEGVETRTKELREKVEELEQFQRLTVNREVRMIELKQEIAKMHSKLESLGVKIDTIF